MKHHGIALLAGCAVLSACGGGGGGSSGSPVGLPSPSPSPSPSASPTPSASYTAYANLTGNQSFGLICQTMLQGPGVMAIGSPTLLYGDMTMTLAYNAAAKTYTLTGYGVAETFGESDIDSTITTAEKAYAKIDAGNFTSRLIIGAPQPGGATAVYTRGLYAFVKNTMTGNNDTYSCAFGVPTLLTDPPTQSPVNFTAFAVNGNALQTYPDGTAGSYRLTSTENSLKVNLTTGQIDISVHLTGQLTNKFGPGTVPNTIDLGTLTGQTEFDGTVTGFGGILNYQDFSLYAPYEGWFFGPKGKEAGIAGAIQKTDDQNVRTVGTFGFTASR